MANTPNLDLVKPAGTDKALVSVLNSNSDKIDGGFGTLSEQIATYNFGSNTLANIQSAIVAYANGMPERSSKDIYFTISAVSAPFVTTVYMGTLYKTNSTRLNVEVCQALDPTGPIYGRYREGTWTWEQLAFESEIKRELIASGSNLDSVATIASGQPDKHFYGTDISTMVNKPSTETNTFPFALDVLNYGGYMRQILHVYAPNGMPRTYIRQQYYVSSSSKPYGTWEQLITSNNFEVSSGYKLIGFHVSDTRMTLNLVPLAGINGKQLRIDFNNGTATFQYYDGTSWNTLKSW